MHIDTHHGRTLAEEYGANECKGTTPTNRALSSVVEKDEADEVTMVSSGQQLRVTGAKGPFAHIINGMYMCSSDQDHHSKQRDEQTIYYRCIDNKAKDNYEIRI